MHIHFHGPQALSWFGHFILNPGKNEIPDDVWDAHKDARLGDSLEPYRKTLEVQGRITYPDLEGATPAAPGAPVSSADPNKITADNEDAIDSEADEPGAEAEQEAHQSALERENDGAVWVNTTAELTAEGLAQTPAMADETAAPVAEESAPALVPDAGAALAEPSPAPKRRGRPPKPKA